MPEPIRPRRLIPLFVACALLALTRPVQAQDALALAVTTFANHTHDGIHPELAWGLSDMLMTDLSVSKDLRLVERKRLTDVVAELKLSGTAMVDPKTAQKMGKLIGADMVLTGAVTAMAPTLRLDARVVSVETGEVLAAAKAEGPIAEFFKVEADLATALLEKIGAAVSPLQRARIHKPPTRDLQAMRAYSSGLQESEAGNKDKAREAYQRALKADPGFKQAQQRLAALEQRVEVLEKRTEAVERAGGLILRPQTAVDYLANTSVHMSRGEEDKALAALSEAVKLAPRAIDVLGRHAELYARKKGTAPAEAQWGPLIGKGGDLRLALAISALVGGQREPADAATAALLRQAPPGDAGALAAARVLRLRALSPPINTEPTAPELQEAAQLVQWLARGAERQTWAGVAVDAAAREALREEVAGHVTRMAAPSPGTGVSRAELAAEPVAIALVENRDQRGRPFLLQLRVAEPGISEVVVTLPAVAPKAGARPEPQVKLPLTFAGQGGKAESSLWQAPFPSPQPTGWQTFAVRYLNRRGEVVDVKREVLLPQMWNGSWRGRTLALGTQISDRFPMLYSRFAALEEADQNGSVLVDAIAGVWSQPVKLDWVEFQPLYATQPSVVATGGLVAIEHKVEGRQEMGFIRPLVYRAGTERHPRMTLVGTGRYLRQRTREKSQWLSRGESIVGEAGLDAAPMMRAPGQHAMGLLTAGEWKAGVDAYLDTVRGRADTWIDQQLSTESGAYALVYAAAAATRARHRQPELHALCDRIGLSGWLGPWLSAMATFARKPSDPKDLWMKAANLDADPNNPGRRTDPWRFRSEAATLVVLLGDDWDRDAGSLNLVREARRHVLPGSWEWPQLVARVRDQVLRLPPQVKVTAWSGRLSSVSLPPALTERLAPREATPARQVSVKAFYIDRDEATVDEYAACVEAGACREILSDHCGAGMGRNDSLDLRGDQATSCLPVSPNPYPVTHVLRAQAADYCRWRGGSLPTLDQWQVAARSERGVGAPWGTEGLDGSRDNLFDAVSCDLRFGQKTPAFCEPKQIRAALPWDGWMHVAPAGSHPDGASAAGAAHMAGNVREWLAGPEDRAAGCGFLDPPGTDASWCTSAIARVTTPLAEDVGFRCVYASAPTQTPAAQSRRSRKPARRTPALKWVRVPGGSMTAGVLSWQEPVILLEKPDDAARKRLLAALVGAKDAEVTALLKRLGALGLKGEISASLVQEWVSRPRWQGVPFTQAADVLVEAIQGKDSKAFKALFDVYVNADSMIGTWARKQRVSVNAMAPADMHQAIFEGIVQRFRGRPVTNKPNAVPRWNERRSFGCGEQPTGRCADTTGAAGSRISGGPMHGRTAKVSAFSMLQTEVTQAQFRQAMGYDPSFHRCDDCPVERVTWQEARTFCQRVGGRLPTEFEWEYAARGKLEAPLPGPVDAMVWHRGNTQGTPGRAGKLRPNQYGLMGMLGGVWEWTEDLFWDGDQVKSALRRVAIQPEKADSGAKAAAPAGRMCLRLTRYAAQAERNLDRIKWDIDEKRGTYLACFKDKETAQKALEDALAEDPKGPAVPKDRASKPQLRVLRGGSWAGDERLIDTRSRVGYREDQRSTFAGFRCAR